MKKILFFLLMMTGIFSSHIYAQGSPCNLVSGYMPDAYKVYSMKGETLETVPAGQELWLRMNPSHVRNTKERGGCRLSAGAQYVADRNGIPIRAYECGNAIVDYKFYPTSSNTTTISSMPGELNVTVNVNTSQDRDLQQGYDNRIGGLNDDRILVSDEYARINFPQYNDLTKNPEVKQRKWLGRNWWIIPAALVTGYIVADGLSDGEWFEWFDHPFTKTTKIIVYYDPNDPNNPNYDPNHNPNAGDWGGGIERPITNIAFDSYTQRIMSSSGGFKIGLGFLRL